MVRGQSILIVADEMFCLDRRNLSLIKCHLLRSRAQNIIYKGILYLKNCPKESTF